MKLLTKQLSLGFSYFAQMRIPSAAYSETQLTLGKREQLHNNSEKGKKR
jgi:hypothetical protein